MSFTPTATTFRRLLEALAHDLQAPEYAPGAESQVNDGLTPIGGPIEHVVRYDGFVYDAIEVFISARRSGTSVLLSFGQQQATGPRDGMTNPLRATMPIEIAVIRVADGIHDLQDVPYELDDRTDEVMKALHNSRRSPHVFGFQALTMETVRKLDGDTDWFGRLLIYNATRDLRNLTS